MEMDVVEEVLEMLAYLTFYGTGISDSLWSLWPRLHAMLVEWGIQVGRAAGMARMARACGCCAARSAPCVWVRVGE